MEPQSSQGSKDHHTTNQVANGLNQGRRGGAGVVQDHSSILLQLEDKFYLGFSEPLWGQKGAAALPKSTLGL